MKKMRFIQRNTFGRQAYITELDGEECLFTLKTRLNMLPIYGNYKGDNHAKKVSLLQEGR